MSAPNMTDGLAALREASASLHAYWLMAAQDITPEEVALNKSDRLALLKERVDPSGYVLFFGEDIALSCDASVNDGVVNYVKTLFPDCHISVGDYGDENSNHYSSRIVILDVDEHHPVGVKNYGSC